MKTKHLRAAMFVGFFIVGTTLLGACGAEKSSSTDEVPVTEPGISTETPPTKQISEPSQEDPEIKTNENTESESQEDFLSYNNSNYNISINYPADWSVTENALGAVVAFLSPLEGYTDIFQENVNIVIQDLSTQPMTLDEFTELSLDQVKQFISDIDIVSVGTSTISGNPAHKAIYTGRQGEYNLKWLQSWTIKNNKAYIVTYTAEENNYSDFASTVREIFNSFEIS